MSAEEDLTSFEEDLKEVFQAIYSDPSNSDSILDAKDTLKQMSIRARGIQDKERKEAWKSKIKALELELGDLQRQALTGGAAGRNVQVPQSSSFTHEIGQSFERQNQALDGARRVLAETEEIGQSIMVNLAEQKEVIKRSQLNIKETNEELGSTNRILDRMGKWWRG